MSDWHERRGLPAKRAWRGGNVLFIFAIGAIVAGAGAAALHYRDALLWDGSPHSEQHATEPEPTSSLTLTNAEEVTPAATPEPEAKPDAGVVQAKKPTPVHHAHAPKPKPAEPTKSDEFSNPE